jgi:hypothetical protein
MVCLCHDEAAWEARVSKHHLTNIREMRELNNTTLTVGFRVVRKFCSLKEATFAPYVCCGLIIENRRERLPVWPLERSREDCEVMDLHHRGFGQNSPR